MSISPTGHSDPSLLTSTLWFRFMLHAIEQTGLDSLAIAEEVGLYTSTLLDPEAAISDEYSHLLMLAASNRSGDPHYGLHAAAHVKPTAFGALGYAMMSSPDLLSALKRTSSLGAAVTQAVTTRLVTGADGSRLDFQMHPFSPSVCRHVQEFTIMLFLNFLRWLVGRPFHPLQVTLMTKAPESDAEYLACFGVMPKFEASMASLTFSVEQMSWPLIGSDPALVDIIDRYAGDRALHMGQPTASQLTRRAVMRRIHDGEPTLAKTAGMLNIGTRTLQRRLESEGTTFQELIDLIRRDLLETHINNNDVSLKQLAAMLGFADQSSLTRAIHRWYDMTPSELRQKRIADVGNAH